MAYRSCCACTGVLRFATSRIDGRVSDTSFGLQLKYHTARTAVRGQASESEKPSARMVDKYMTKKPKQLQTSSAVRKKSLGFVPECFSEWPRSIVYLCLYRNRKLVFRRTDPHCLTILLIIIPLGAQICPGTVKADWVLETWVRFNG